jgi:hypothetical protein
LKTVHDLLKKEQVRRPGEDFLGENVLLKGNAMEDRYQVNKEILCYNRAATKRKGALLDVRLGTWKHESC